MLLRLAFRNLWRNRRRTLLTLSAMVVSAALLMLALGVFSGMLADMLESATEQYHGHLVVSAGGYQQERDLYTAFEPTEDLGRALRAQEEFRGFSPRLRAFGLLSRERNTQPVEVLGVRPEAERQVTTLADKVTRGRFLSGDSGREVVIGRGLAEKLEADPGDEVVFVSQAADGSIANDLLTVVGIFATGDAGHDNALALAPLEWLGRTMALPGRVHEIAVALGEPMKAPEVARNLQSRLPEGLEAVDWGRLLPEMREAIATYDVTRMILVVILYLATGLGVLNTFFMSVMERTREFGILMALGMKPGRIRALVLLETFSMGAISLLFGVSAGVLLTLWMERFGIDLSAFITPVTYAGGTILPRLRAVLEAENILIPAAILLLVCLAAGYLPARRAARLKPVEAIRED